MKRILLFTLPILVIIAGVFAVFGFLQVRFQEERLYDDLKRKAKNVAESMELSARDIFIKNDVKTAQRLADIFQKRERLQGCVFYSRDMKVLAVTEKVVEFLGKDEKGLIKISIIKGEPADETEKHKEYSLYSYIFPVRNDNNEVLGVLKVIYDTSYINNTLTELWRRTSITLFGLIIAIVIVILILQRQIFTLPLRRLTEWFQLFQKGDIDDQFKIKDIDDFGKFASEVEQVALGLRVARKSLSTEALRNLNKAELWDETKLKNLVHAKLGENSFFVVSNREPYMHVLDEDTNQPKCIRPASGVVTALDPILKACGGMWIAQGSGQADRKFVNSKDKLGVPPQDIHYILKRIWLSKEEENGYYLGFSNEGLWPLCHITYTRPTFRQTDWEVYKKVNEKFAESILEELPSKTPFVFIQDYHFTLLPKLIKEKRPDAIVAMFWHIPWPNPEVFSICPYQEEILDGMLGCDLIGFHVQYHCNNFIDTCNRLLESRIDTEKFSVVRNNKETLIRAFPISVDTNTYAGSKETAQSVNDIKKEYDLEDKIIGIGVERIDYTKGLVERMLAIEKLLEKYPEYRKKIVYIQLAAPSRTHIKKYHELMGEIDEVVERINWKYSDNGWKPIIYLKQHFSSDEIKPYYAMADFCLVSSLHDGMNLVAKEYIASKTDYNGSLILSCFTGAARELADAIQINPYSIDKFADAIRFAVEMPKEEKVKRMKNMHNIVKENNVFKWAGAIINDLTGLKK
ncbi:MAG: trehalose-6-phosphate synthase [Elusimicrobia bacterium]|nr:trehalose-6-phosphate synthase [Candidatus Liberimonas magnetica]